MPEVSSGAVVDRLQKALDAQAAVQKAAKDASAEAARQKVPAPPETPPEERKP